MTSFEAPDWAAIIRTSSVADLGWSAENPAPAEALAAIDDARAASLRFLADPPFIEHADAFPHPEGRSRVTALLISTGAVRAQVDPRTPYDGEHGPVRAAASLIGAFRDGRRLRAADDRLMADLAGMERVREAGERAWEIHHRDGAS
jgi:hypothetical protein